MVAHRNGAMGEVDLASLLQAFALLEPTSDVERALIARSLGFEWRPQNPPASDALPFPPSKPSAPSSAPRRRPKFPASRDPASGRGPHHAPELVAPARTTFEPAGWLANAAARAGVTELERTDAKAHLKRPAHIPLIVPVWVRGVLAAMLTTDEQSRHIDWRAIERTLSKGSPLITVPWRTLPSLRRGAELWLDLSESMQPYWRDESDLARILKRLLGRQAVRVRTFEHEERYGASDAPVWHDDEPVDIREGAAVLLVSDFGVGRARRAASSGLDAVRPWVERATNRGCKVVALVPAPKADWPPALQDLITAFEWDRDLSIRTVASKLRASRSRR